MAEVLINGVRQGWGDVQFVALGMIFTGITEFKLESSQEKSNEMGAGNEPVHRGRGNKSYKAKMKLYMYEVAKILAALPPGKDLTDIAPFTVNLVFTPLGSDLLKRIDVPMTEFLNSGLNVDLKQGDKSIAIDLDLIIGKPIYK